MSESYALPPIELLDPVMPSAIDRTLLERNARLLECVLADFGVIGRIVEVLPGPAFTAYGFEPGPGTRFSQVSSVASDIARNMYAATASVIVNPGRTTIGIELPNQVRSRVQLSELIGSQAFAESDGLLPVALGKSVTGDPVIADLAALPHLLIGGTTGSGKSVGINAMMLSLLYRQTPDRLRLILIDPKRLELAIYDGIPHLLAPVIESPEQATRALEWAVETMEMRHRMMAAVAVRSLTAFNQKVTAAKDAGQRLGRRVQVGYDAESGHPMYEEEEFAFETLPRIVVVIEELADLMMLVDVNTSETLRRLTQRGQAAGIHLVLSSERPSVDVLAGAIKANIPSRIAYAVTSELESRIILDETGAERLIAKGDMLYKPGGRAILRVHGALVGDAEATAVANHCRGQHGPCYVDAITGNAELAWGDDENGRDGKSILADEDPEETLYQKAVGIVLESGKASTSYVQRQLRIGYNSTARFVERMEREGIVGAPDHVGRREVLGAARASTSSAPVRTTPPSSGLFRRLFG